MVGWGESGSEFDTTGPALTRSAQPGDRLNVWLLIEIQIENTLGLMNEKSNSLKSHGVGVLRL